MAEFKAYDLKRKTALKQKKAAEKDAARDILKQVIRAASSQNPPATYMKPVKGGLLDGLSPKKYFEENDIPCSARSFSTYMKRFQQGLPLPKKSGGERMGYGRHRIGEGGEKGKHITEDSSTRRKRKRDQVTHAFDAASAREASTYIETTFLPFVLEIPERILTDTDILYLRDFIHTGFQPEHTNEGDENDLICDVRRSETFPNGATTGQRRRVIFSSDSVMRREGISKNRRNDAGSKLLADSVHVAHPRARGILNNLVGFLTDTLREHDVVNKHADKGYPKTMSETEGMMTPPKSPRQSAHGDSQFRLANVLLTLPKMKAKCTRGKAKSTWVARAGTDLTSPEAKMEFHQFELPSARHVLVNHAAWPHYGPGNATGHARYVLFFVFPLTEAASRHSTSESVHWFT